MERRYEADAGPDLLSNVDDARALRHAFATFATGVTVVTVGGDNPHGMTANSFTTVSLDPPLALICVGRNTIMHTCLLDAPAFGVSVLAAEHAPVARYFSDADRPMGAEQFQAVEWLPGPRTGVPLIAGALAWFECVPWQQYDGGDHTIFVSRLVTAERRFETDGLLFHFGALARSDQPRRTLP
ncbi:flavin reductase family protein [Winogradskya consettensis]|uniref:Oxidoreductase n=1 Tax=Winogradskya consettensis TaxID=113560 RepID=A0A919T2I3_9ACTN|nr:oxidoreductase [Actinoplanes consettensis]